MFMQIVTGMLSWGNQQSVLSRQSEDQFYYLNNWVRESKQAK